MKKRNEISKGTKIAARIKEQFNKLTRVQRAEYHAKALALIGQPKLRPCPMCAGKAMYCQNDIGDVYVTCTCCGLSTSDARCETDTLAARRWNKRDKRNRGEDGRNWER